MIRPERIRDPLIFSNAFTFLVMLGITIWACTKGGTGPLFDRKGFSAAESSVSMTHGWAWFYGITSSVGSVASGIVNQSDFTRFMHKQGQQIPGTIISTLILPGIVVPLFGILTASASMNLYHEAFWNPPNLMIEWLKNDFSATSRAAAFFCGLGFVTGQAAENIASNGYAAGMDLAGLFPKWIDIRRGSIIAALLSWVVQPWLFYNTSSVFMATMSAFSVFLAPLTGIMICDYFLVRRCRVELSHLYTASPEGAYWYTFGFNWRAIVTWFVCFAPALPGMIATLNTSVTINVGALRYYWGNYIFGMHSLLSLLFSLPVITC